MTSGWIRVCDVDDLEPGAIVAFDHAGESYAVIRDEDGHYHVTSGHCTHEKRHLSRGLVQGNEIECEAHCGRFDYRTGEAVQKPAHHPLTIYAVRMTGRDVECAFGATEAA